MIQTHTDFGLENLKSDSLYDKDDCVIEISKNIRQISFLPLEFWETEERATSAMNFCKDIGRQLYEKYLNKRNKEMPAMKLSESALGIRSMALTLAFTHSIPKETLPLFWMKATISKKGKDFEWLALFENGE